MPEQGIIYTRLTDPGYIFWVNAQETPGVKKIIFLWRNQAPEKMKSGGKTDKNISREINR
jgi:hypothetical protein